MLNFVSVTNQFNLMQENNGVSEASQVLQHSYTLQTRDSDKQASYLQQLQCLVLWKSQFLISI